MDFAATEVDPGVGWYLYPRLGYIPYAHTVSCRLGNLVFVLLNITSYILTRFMCVCRLRKQLLLH
jgi:hypothetical protein